MQSFDDDKMMTSLCPNHMRTFIILGRAEALHPLKMELCEHIYEAVGVWCGALHSSNEPHEQ